MISSLKTLVLLSLSLRLQAAAMTPEALRYLKRPLRIEVSLSNISVDKKDLRNLIQDRLAKMSLRLAGPSEWGPVLAFEVTDSPAGSAMGEARRISRLSLKKKSGPSAPDNAVIWKATMIKDKLDRQRTVPRQDLRMLLDGFQNAVASGLAGSKYAHRAAPKATGLKIHEGARFFSKPHADSEVLDEFIAAAHMSAHVEWKATESDGSHWYFVTWTQEGIPRSGYLQEGDVADLGP